MVAAVGFLVADYVQGRELYSSRTVAVGTTIENLREEYAGEASCAARLRGGRCSLHADYIGYAIRDARGVPGRSVRRDGLRDPDTDDAEDGRVAIPRHVLARGRPDQDARPHAHGQQHAHLPYDRRHLQDRRVRCHAPDRGEERWRAWPAGSTNCNPAPDVVRGPYLSPPAPRPASQVQMKASLDRGSSMVAPANVVQLLAPITDETQASVALRGQRQGSVHLTTPLAPTDS